MVPVCPHCHASLLAHGDAVRCAECGATFAVQSGVPNLIVGEQFADRTPDAELAYEERCCIDTTREYWVPLFRRLLGQRAHGARVLSVGCGVGSEVDELVRAGFDCVGIDTGNRARSWASRAARDRLFPASGLHMPFNDESFDIVFCGCLFPHVGDEGDTHRPEAGHEAKRQRLASEMTRVVRRTGYIVVAGVNRACPLDIFHGRESGSYRPRLNSPADPFLLSVSDYRRLFLAARCASLTALPTERFWIFNHSQRSWMGRLLSLPVKAIFWLESRPPLRWLRGSALSPWVVVLAVKEEGAHVPAL